MIQEKKCKGTGKAKGYGCGELVPVARYNQPNRVYGLGKSCGCYSKFLLESDVGKELINKATLKVTKPRREFQKFEQEEKERKSLSYLLVNVRTACHTYIKIRDKGKPCISCNTSWRPDFQAGHFYKAETFSSLKFFEKNIHGQCPKCNLFEDGNESGYRVGLIKRYGKDYVEELDELARKYKQSSFKWSREELKKIRAQYKSSIDALRQEIGS